jgi:hypothetical protein
LIRLLRAPETAGELTVEEWDEVVRGARASRLLGHLWARLGAAQAIDRVPKEPLRHLDWGRRQAEKHGRAMLRETEFIRAALSGLGAQPIFLKGAAYLLARSPCAEGRLFGDVDILVPREALADAERALVVAGWRPENLDDYDQRYYRKWMHELPPLRHVTRGTVVDVHHTILPLTARPRVDARRIIAAAMEAPGTGGALVLSPEDMTLHAVAHCFYDGDFQQGLRELADIDSLLRSFAAADVEFWRRLVRRAGELDLEVPLWRALRAVVALLGAPVPESAFRALAHAAPGPVRRVLMDALLLRALRPHVAPAAVDVRISLVLLYIRSHYLRMPLKLLLPHLARKAAMGVLPARKRPA